MKKSWLVAAILLVAAAAIWIAALSTRHPDTSNVAPFGPYATVGGSIAPAWSPDDKALLYCTYSEAGANLYTISANGGTPKIFSSGIREGCLPAWSPDGTLIAFSSSQSETFQLMRALGLARALNIWTASAGGGNPRQITHDSAALLDPSWSPDGDQVALTKMPGPHVMTARRSGGEATLIADGLSPAWSPDGKRLAYFASESGGIDAPFRIHVQAAAGGTSKVLHSFVLQSNFFFRPSLDWSTDSERLLAVQAVDGRWQPLVINVTEDRIERTVPVAGSVIGPRWSHDDKRVAYALTDTGHPAHVEVVTLATQQTTQLTPVRGYTTGDLVRYQSGDLAIPSWLYVPHDANGAKHPALVWLHGGFPGSSSVLDEFDPTIQYFVDQGFVVLAPNYRGSAGFGAELAKFARGDDMVPDVIAAVDYLKALKAVDPAHIGVIGFSFGAYLTLRCITQVPHLFAAAVDFFGPTDLVKYYQDNPKMRDRLRDLLGGTPEENREAYVAASPINFVQRIDSPLLILHGTRDEAAPYSDSADLAKALERAHKKYEFITYRFAGHGFSGKDDIDAKQQAMRFFLAHLRAPSS